MKSFFKSPLGWLQIEEAANTLRSIRFVKEKPNAVEQQANDVIEKTIIQLKEYFEGNRQEFSINIAPNGTPFQKEVWHALMSIPYGQTISYGKLAKQLGNTNKVRAVGRANGQNPIPIIIPCHRVIDADNHLVGYSGGIERKRYLLKHEGALLL